MKNILICGHRSFVATGLIPVLEKKGMTYDCFSRGDEKREGQVVTGDVMKIADNQNLDTYDTVVNYILLKERSIDENIEYIKSLLSFCKKAQIKKLIQISSISVYPNEAEYVNEKSELEIDFHNKGGYASLKVAVDHYLMENPIENLQVCFVRPGYIYEKNREPSRVGIVVSKFGMNILLGDKKTTLPLVNKNKIHEAITKIANADKVHQVYLLLNKDRKLGTKYNFVNHQWNLKPICLNASFFLKMAKLLNAFHVFKHRHYLKFVGLFKRTWFDSTNTEKALEMSFAPRSIAVLGAGTYGSYVSNLLSEVYPHECIELFDVGDENIKTEEEIGYLSHITNNPYEGLQKGRFFGYGGSSVKWGGQLLAFSENDFANPTPFMKDITELNIKYKDKVLSRFHLINNIPEHRLNDKLFTKTGIWLSYFHRNLFKFFGIANNDKVHIHTCCRITKLLSQNNHIIGFEYIHDGKLFKAEFDNYFLTSGAFESGRLLLNSGLSEEKNLLSFSDHLSQRAFKVTSGPKIGDEDFTFHVQGASLVTKRFVGEIDGYSFYSQPINNEDFPFFQDLKKLLFGHHISASLIIDIVKNIPHCIAFVWCMLFLKKLYVYKNEFYLQIDIEAPRESGKIKLNEERDKFGEKSVDVDLSIIEKTGYLFSKARGYIKQYLDENHVQYTELPFSTTAEKYEDVYHPFGIFCDFKDVNDYFTHFDNMLVVNTGILPRAGGINSTCSVMPLVEEYVHNVMN
ncbi:NAD-dependent epimerase/dehydratase family protein [Prevotella sp.]|uniref:NAD-dependent epimerase/dehydratase family protein n=1 Tax=Prevotella sp. TaxID=59823 RepID=UPI002647FEBE|nr:NAD-dependent epimerase/dehydratase family protein [Prevotella sp.]MDN5554908.1 NAD-dependent epimerase/dehydratase family protein [Prevotella sp.]